MAIVILRGPDGPANHHRAPLSRSVHPDVIASLVDSAVCAGKTLAIRVCNSPRELVSALDILDRDPPEMLLFDPGESLKESDVQTAVQRLRVPYIEMHDDTIACESSGSSGAPHNRIWVVHGFKAQSYVVAMDKALEHLGCSDCHSEYHVGT